MTGIEAMVYVIRVDPQGHPDPERGPDGPYAPGEAVRRARQEPDPHSGWRDIIVTSDLLGCLASDQLCHEKYGLELPQ